MAGGNSHDPVKKPAHYNFSKYEVIKVIEAWKLDYYIGNVVKYIARAPYKGEELQDLKKAQFYLRRKIRLIELANKCDARRADGPAQLYANGNGSKNGSMGNGAR